MDRWKLPAAVHVARAHGHMIHVLGALLPSPKAALVKYTHNY